MIKLIAAIGLNNVIGKDNNLIWYLPDDLKRFKQLTLNSIVVMGSNTFINDLNSKPLSNRYNIVLSKTLTCAEDNNLVVYRSVQEVLQYKDFWVIGGSTIYQQFLPLVQEMYLTHIHKAIDGDSYFPYVNYKEWNILNQKNYVDYSFITYRRK